MYSFTPLIYDKVARFGDPFICYILDPVPAETPGSSWPCARTGPRPRGSQTTTQRPGIRYGRSIIC